MRRLRPLDAALLAVFVPLWVLCFTLHTRELLGERLAWIPFTVAAGSGAEPYPAISGIWPDAESETEQLRVGDRLVRVGDLDLAGTGPFSFAAAVYTAVEPGHGVRAKVIRDGEPRETSFALRPVGVSWRLPLVSLGFALPGFLVLWRRPGSGSSRAFFAASLCFSLYSALIFGRSPLQTYFGISVFLLAGSMLYPLMFRAVLAVPGEPGGSRWGPAWVWLFSLGGVSTMSWVFGTPLPFEVGLRATAALNALAPIILVALITRNYVRSNAIGRRQLRWIVYGLYVGALPVGLGSLVPVVTPRLWWLHEVLMTTVVFAPICFFIAIVRYNFFDIDRLISATLSYNIVLALAVAAGIVAVPLAGDAVSDALGVAPTGGKVVLSTLLAVVVVPAHRILRPRIDRVLFAERYAVEQGIEELIQELSGCGNTHDLIQRTGTTLHRVLHPETCVVYSRSEAGYSPAFAEADAKPTEYDGKSPLVAALRGRREPLVLDRSGRGEGSSPVAAFDRAVLATLGAAVVVGVRHGQDLLGFLCLGPKRSGDVYTRTDLILLDNLAGEMATELSRL